MRFGKIAKSLLKSVAPLIGGAIGGPFGAAAGTFLKKALGTDDEAEIEKMLASASPETLVKLKDANQQFQVKMKELGIAEDQLYIEDTQSARGMAEKLGFTPQLILSIAFVGGYFLILGMLLAGFLTVPENLRDMTMILLGVLAAEVTRIMAFWFGSTKGSSDKNIIMAKAMDK